MYRHCIGSRQVYRTHSKKFEDVAMQRQKSYQTPVKFDNKKTYQLASQKQDGKLVFKSYVILTPHEAISYTYVYRVNFTSYSHLVYIHSTYFNSKDIAYYIIYINIIPIGAHATMLSIKLQILNNLYRYFYWVYYYPEKVHPLRTRSRYQYRSSII